jgi:hypothetical protein
MLHPHRGWSYQDRRMALITKLKKGWQNLTRLIQPTQKEARLISIVELNVSSFVIESSRDENGLLRVSFFEAAFGAKTLLLKI